MSRKISTTQYIKENRELRSYLDLVEQDIKNQLEIKSVDMFDRHDIYDYSCTKKCGGIFERNRQSYLTGEKGFVCELCGRQKELKNIKFIEEKVTLKKDVMGSINKTIDYHVSTGLENVVKLRQVLLKLYRMWTDNMVVPVEQTERQERDADMLYNSICGHFGITESIKDVKFLSLITTDGIYVRNGDDSYGFNEVIRAKKINEVEFTQLEDGRKINDMLERQLTIKNFLDMIKLNIPEQTPRDTLKKSEEKLFYQSVNVVEDSLKIKYEIDTTNELKKIHQQNKEQREKHEKLLKTDIWYTLHHCHAHVNESYIHETSKDEEDAEPDKYEMMRFWRNDADKFYLPLIKENHYDYQLSGMVNRRQLIKSLEKIDPTLNPNYELHQMQKKSQQAENDKFHDEFVKKTLLRAGIVE